MLEILAYFFLVVAILMFTVACGLSIVAIHVESCNHSRRLSRHACWLLTVGLAIFTVGVFLGVYSV